MRLSDATLAALPDSIERPAYDRAALEPGIVHLGIGGFHRAHQAWYVERALSERFGPWGITGVSLRKPDVHDALDPQDGLYTLAVRDGTGTRARVIGAVRGVMVAPRDPGAVVARLADPSTRLITLTITEKGYCLDGAQRLDPNHPDVMADMAGRKTSAIGFLVAALARIRAAGGVPPTIVSCDNLPSNGRVLARALADHAAMKCDPLSAWIEDVVACPSGMVDRIVPAATDADRAEVLALTGLEDAAPVVTEPFSQWVLEDRFGGPMPQFGAVGVELVGDVAPHERMKLRLLNGAHSALAYLAQLAGLEFVADVIADPDLGPYVGRFMAEASGAVSGLPEAQIAAYQPALLTRFANPAVRHRTRQIAMDGSQKLPQRWLSTLGELVAAGRPHGALVIALAAWFRFLGGVGDQGQALTIDDPRAAELAALARSSDRPRAIVDAMLDRSGLFSDALRESESLRAHLADALTTLSERGARAVVRAR